MFWGNYVMMQLERKVWFLVKYNYSNDFRELDDSNEELYSPVANLLSDDCSGEPYNPLVEKFKEYVELFETFNPINEPPAPPDKNEYINKFIIPILQNYAKGFGAIIEIDEQEDFVKINIIAKEIVIINSNSDFNSILFYATSYRLITEKENIKVELYFSTRIEA